VLVARRLGYAVSRIPITVPTDGVRSVDIVMSTSALQLDQLTVTADRTGRARGELGTASVIDRDAIANQIASSLQGVLELVPGVPLQPPGLDAAAQFSLRALATSPTAGVGGLAGPGAADIGAAGTLIVLDGIPLSNNANLQTVGARGETVPTASTAGGGIDLRRIPASTLERVEVIRGIPSARWGDYDRPRRFSETPALATSALYADTRFAWKQGQMSAEIQPGVRVETLHEGQWWSSEARTAMAQPRLTAQLSPWPWLRFRGGAGVVSKAPSIAQLSPARQYYDLVNVNRFTPDPRERLAVVTTFIRDPTNPDLGLSRATKREAGIELDGGQRRGSMSVTWFDDRIAGAVTLRREPAPLQRARYALADTGRGTGQPGRIVDPPIGFDPVPVFLDRYVNGGALDSRGVEFVVSFPVIPALRTRVEASGAAITTHFATNDRDYGAISRLNDFQVDTAIKRVAYFDGAATRSKRAILTWRVVHQQPDLGLVITTTIQQRIGDERRVLTRTDSLAFTGYILRDGTLVSVAESDKGRAEFADLRRLRPSTGASRSSQPNDWLMSLQVAKSLGRSGRLSFYIFNALDKFITYGSGGSARALPSTRFGAELTLPTSDLFGGAR